jgi:DNA-binding NarL/FixJ family response regulator
MLTSCGEEADIVAAAASCADGYVLKTSEDEVLVAAITTVASGGTVWPSFARKVLLHKSDMRD